MWNGRAKLEPASRAPEVVFSVQVIRPLSWHTLREAFEPSRAAKQREFLIRVYVPMSSALEARELLTALPVRSGQWEHPVEPAVHAGDGIARE
jgi:hypothetical protein